MIQPKFDVLDFSPFTKSQWKKRYLSDIRVNAKWGKVKIQEVGLVQAEESNELVLPWYTGGDSWLDGIPRVEYIGTKMCMIRIPALAISGNKYLILDGCHRITELKPSIVMIDWIIPDSFQYFTDLRNLDWLKEINPTLD